MGIDYVFSSNKSIGQCTSTGAAVAIFAVDFVITLSLVLPSCGAVVACLLKIAISFRNCFVFTEHSPEIRQEIQCHSRLCTGARLSASQS
jgi:hypothetical protein